MRKYISILIVFLSCNLLTELHEIYFLPALFSHYQAHLKTEKISFLDFIQLHYSESNEHSTSDEHNNLPFKHKINHFLGFAVYFLTTQQNELPNCAWLLITACTEQPTTFYQNFWGILRLLSIWHPPCF